MSKSLLFIGTHLSRSTGSLSASETICNLLRADGYKCQLVSRHRNKILRLLDISYAILFARYDIANIDVFSGNAFRIAEWSSLLLKITGKPMIMSLHGGRLPEFTKENSGLVLKTLKRASYVQSPSKFLISFFEENYDIEINYVPNPVDKSNFKFNKVRRFTGVAPKLLWVRAFTDIYRPELAVLVLREVRKKYKEATLTMVGPDKGLLNSVMKRIDELALSQAIEIVGPVANRNLLKYYSSHDIYLNTTQYESFGISVIEAALCGIPVVTTSAGEIPHLWEHGKEISIINDPNASNFAVEINRLLEDCNLVKSYTEKARSKAELFSWEKISPVWKHFVK